MGYTTREVADLLHLSPSEVRSYVRTGVLTPARDAGGGFQFSFQDLVLLRAARGLAEARIPRRRIHQALRRLAQQLPEGRPLSELRISAEGDRIVVRDGGATWAPESGQLQLDFAVAELAERVAPLARRRLTTGTERGFVAEDWFELGVELEQPAPAEARQAYQRALDLDPGHAAAHVNLGRLLHEQGDAARAAEHYRAALALSPADATAAFNLGTALEDLGRPADAITAYQQALRHNPRLADAHYNLALLYEKAGIRDQALSHLSSYKSLGEAR